MTQGTVVEQTQIGNTFAGCQVTTDIVTHAGHQYAAFYTVNRNIAVRHRTVGATGDGPWSDPKYLREDNYNPDDYGKNHSYKHDWDSHDWIRLGVDKDGNLHVTGDHHGNQLRYWRTSTPGDLTTLARKKNIVNENFEKMVTYPEFINGPSGHMRWLMFRDGSSGDGIVRVYEWDDDSNTWSNTAGAALFGSSSDPDYNAYTETYYTLDGWYHVVYCWRRTANSATNGRLSYVKTQDFKTFYNDAGQAQSLPIRHGNTACIVDDVPEGTPSFINSEWQFGQVGSQKFIAYVKDGDMYVSATPTAGGAFGTGKRMTSVGDVGGFGNGFLDNYLGCDDGSHMFADFSLDPTGRPTRRVTFQTGDAWATGAPNLPVTTPPQYEPDAVYQAPDTQPGLSQVYFRTRADSRTSEQAGAQNRNYIASRPLSGFHYVMGCLMGPDVFSDPGIPQADQDQWPARPVVVTKVAY